MINAVTMSTKVEGMLPEKNIIGVIHSVFDSAFNIQLPGNQLIGVITSGNNENPYSITIELKEGQTMHSLYIKQGMKVVINKSSVRSLVGRLHINLENTKWWEPSVPQEMEKLVGKEQLYENIQTIYKTLISHGKFYGIGPVIFENPDIRTNEDLVGKNDIDIKANHYSNFISPRIDELLYGLEQEDKTLIRNMLTRIVGFGPGLTPSADDMLVGIMATMYYLESYLQEEIKLISYLQEGLDQECISQTTLVSQQMLKAAAKGEFPKTIKELCIACISSVEGKDIEENVLKTIELGSTSGTDTIVGFLIGYYLVNKKYNFLSISTTK